MDKSYNKYSTQELINSLISKQKQIAILESQLQSLKNVNTSLKEGLNSVRASKIEPDFLNSIGNPKDNLSDIDRLDAHSIDISGPFHAGQNRKMKGIYVQKRLAVSRKKAGLLDREISAKIMFSGLQVHVFKKASLEQALQSLTEGTRLEGVDLNEEIKNPFFRFVTIDDQKLSFATSNAISHVLRRPRSITPELTQMAIQKNKEIADEFATTMYSIVEKLKSEKGIRTYRAIVEALNENEVPTSKGGKWHLKTLQDLNQRWKELGLMEERKPS